MTRPDQAGRLDDALRARHAEAVEHISERTRVQLHNRLSAALSASAGPATHRPVWGWALACSMALVAVFGMHLRTSRTEVTTPIVSERSDDNGDLVASLDENPDLYLWLASNDASGFVPE